MQKNISRYERVLNHTAASCKWHRNKPIPNFIFFILNFAHLLRCAPFHFYSAPNHSNLARNTVFLWVFFQKRWKLFIFQKQTQKRKQKKLNFLPKSNVLLAVHSGVYTSISSIHTLLIRLNDGIVCTAKHFEWDF